jgi:hypothetical protein
MQRRRAKRNRQQEQRGIDDPVALRSAQGRILVGSDEQGGQEAVSAHWGQA